MDFIREMGGWPLYKALCLNKEPGTPLTPLRAEESQ